MICAVACFNNPCGWKNRTKNLITFVDNFKGCPLYVIEASDGEFFLKDSFKVRAKPDNNFLWQKERLLNIAAEQVPDKFDKIAWIDCDVIFHNENWVKEAEKQVNEHGVCQLFETIDYLDKQRRAFQTWQSVGVGQSQKGFHPGFAWATHRDNFPLVDHHIYGSGDLYMANWWLNHDLYIDAPKSQQKKDESEKQRLTKQTNGTIGCVSGNISHLYHGSIEDRRYTERHKTIAQIDFNPELDIAIDDNGMWRWNGNDTLREYMAGYLINRKEDK